MIPCKHVRWSNCDASLGPTDCYHFRCVCKSDYVWNPRVKQCVHRYTPAGAEVMPSVLCGIDIQVHFDMCVSFVVAKTCLCDTSPRSFLLKILVQRATSMNVSKSSQPARMTANAFVSLVSSTWPVRVPMVAASGTQHCSHPTSTGQTPMTAIGGSNRTLPLSPTVFQLLRHLRQQPKHPAPATRSVLVWQATAVPMIWG